MGKTNKRGHGRITKPKARGTRRAFLRVDSDDIARVACSGHVPSVMERGAADVRAPCRDSCRFPAAPRRKAVNIGGFYRELNAMEKIRR